MYLSHLELNTRVKEVRRDIANLYDMHSTLKRAFSDNERFLWRMENRQGGYPVVLVQSIHKPSWGEILVDGYFVSHKFKEYYINDCIRQGRCLRFRIEANPTVKRENKRRALLTPEEQIKWFSGKAKTYGFNIQSLTIEKPRLASMVKRKTGDIIQIHSVLFEGVLEVVDKEGFLTALKSGIGPAKGFGFGLLSVAGSEY